MKKSIPYLSVVIALLFTILLVGGIVVSTQADGPDQGYVVIQTDSGQRWIREISFTSPINGIDALVLANQEIITTTTAYGVAVCSIGGVGCPADNCFCASEFWNYQYWDGSAWINYSVGADSSSLSDGAIEGWRWDEWGVGAIPTATHLIAANKALDYVLSVQNSDGGYTGTSSSAETLLSIGANEIHPADWRKSGNEYSLGNYWLKNSAGYADNGAAEAGKLGLGITGASFCFPDGTVLPSSYYSSTTGAYSTDGSGYQAWAMLGVASTGETVPAQAVTYLKDQILTNGAWEWASGYGADTNTTSLAIQALIAGGESITATEVISGLNYLQSAQNTDGGFPYDPVSAWGTDSDANSTAYAIQAILAAGGNPEASPWVQSGGSPYDYLLGAQLVDGSFEWQTGYGSNILATQQAIPALLHRFFPINIASSSNCPTIFLPDIVSPDS